MQTDGPMLWESLAKKGADLKISHKTFSCSSWYILVDLVRIVE